MFGEIRYTRALFTTFFLWRCAFAQAPQRASTPWDQPFASDTEAIREAARAVQAGEDDTVSVLLHSFSYQVMPSGGVHSVERKVFRIIRDNAVDDWGTVDQRYQPWRESKPAIRARIITSAGAVYQLDQKTISETPAVQYDATIFSDSRILKAPLPAAAAGSVIEYEVTTVSNPSLPGAGIQERIQIFNNVPIQRFHFSIDAPESVPLPTKSWMLNPDAIHRSTANGQTHIEADFGPYKTRENTEANLPSEISNWPNFMFSTARSWNAVAAQYTALVEKQLQAADVSGIMKGINLQGSPLEVAGRLVTILHRNIRYTGLEFGESAILPARPVDVLNRKYGDCKDKATLLLAMLRAAGIKAQVALLNAGSGLDIDPAIPGMDLFDHVIVHVDTNPPVWIDATANATRAGRIPVSDQGRYALIASESTMVPERVPEQLDDLEKRSWDVRFNASGKGNISETMEGQGTLEEKIRSTYVLNGDPRSALEKYVKSAYKAKSLGKYTVSGSDDLAAPVKVTVEAVATPQAVTTSDYAQVFLSPSRVLDGLPWSLRPDSLRETDDPAEKKPKRSNDFVFSSAGRFEDEFRLYPPALYNLSKMPVSGKTQVGVLTWEREYRKNSDGSVTFRFALEIPKRRLTPGEYEVTREAIRKNATAPAEPVNFIPQTAEFLAIGEPGKALALLRDEIKKHPGDAGLHGRLCRTLLAVGLGGPALIEARKATEIDPTSSAAWQDLAWAQQHDVFGRRFSGEWNRDVALQSLRKAVELDPEDLVAKADLAILLEFNSLGERYGSGAEMDKAIDIYREIQQKQFNLLFQTNLTASLFFSGRTDEAEEASRKSTENQRIIIGTAITTLRQGAPRAIIDLQSQVVDAATRSQYLTAAGFLMLQRRRYEDANTLIKAAARNANSAQLAPMLQILAHVKPSEEALVGEDDPRRPAQKLLLYAIRGNAKISDLQPIISSREKFTDFSDGMDEMQAGFTQQMRQLATLGMTRENMVDLSLSSMKIEKEGDDDHGYRITIAMGSSPILTLYVVKEAGRYVILGVSESPEHVGELVLDLVARNELENARKWLDTVVKDLNGDSSGWLPAAKGLWSGLTPDTRDAKAIRATAAAMMGRYSNSPRAIEILRGELPKAPNALVKSQMDAALCEALAKAKMWDELLVVAKRLMASKTFSHQGFLFTIQAARELQNWKILEDVATQRLAADSKDNDALKQLAISKILRGDFAVAEAAITKYKLATTQTEQARELQAWNEILGKKVTSDSLKSFMADSAGEKGADADFQYTVAMLELSRGESDSAQQALKAALGTQNPKSADARAWVAFGKVCEQYGFGDFAPVAYAKARSARNDKDAARWSLRLIP